MGVVAHTVLQVNGFKTTNVLFRTCSLFVGIVTYVTKARYTVLYSCM